MNDGVANYSSGPLIYNHTFYFFFFLFFLFFFFYLSFIFGEYFLGTFWFLLLWSAVKIVMNLGNRVVGRKISQCDLMYEQIHLVERWKISSLV